MHLVGIELQKRVALLSNNCSKNLSDTKILIAKVIINSKLPKIEICCRCFIFTKPNKRNFLHPSIFFYTMRLFGLRQYPGYPGIVIIINKTCSKICMKLVVGWSHSKLPTGLVLVLVVDTW